MRDAMLGGLGFVLGFILVTAFIFMPWAWTSVVFAALATLLILSPFTTSGKGDRDYREE